MSSPDVEYVAEDGYMSAFDTQYVESSLFARNVAHIARTNATWGLARVSSRPELTNQNPFASSFEYKYLPKPGNDIDIYVVDTGLFLLFILPKRVLICFQASTSNMYASVAQIVSGGVLISL